MTSEQPSPAGGIARDAVEDRKRAAAQAAAELVRDGERVGLGTGSTVAHLLPALAARALHGVRCAATSPATERAARALGCSGACRIDLLVTEGENEYVLEVNTLPGMTPTSLLPKIAASAGVDYGSLCEAILRGARLHAGLPEPEAGPRSSQVSSSERDLHLVPRVAAG